MECEDSPYTVDGTTISCQCVGKHIPKAMELERHFIWPLEEGGPAHRSNTITICPTTHSNIHKLWKIYEAKRGRPSWEILKNYSEFVREVVERGRELRRAHNEAMANATVGAST